MHCFVVLESQTKFGPTLARIVNRCLYKPQSVDGKRARAWLNKVNKLASECLKEKFNLKNSRTRVTMSQIWCIRGIRLKNRNELGNVLATLRRRRELCMLLVGKVDAKAAFTKICTIMEEIQEEYSYLTGPSHHQHWIPMPCKMQRHRR